MCRYIYTLKFTRRYKTRLYDIVKHRSRFYFYFSTTRSRNLPPKLCQDQNFRCLRPARASLCMYVYICFDCFRQVLRQKSTLKLNIFNSNFLFWVIEFQFLTYCNLKLNNFKFNSFLSFPLKFYLVGCWPTKLVVISFFYRRIE